MILKSSVFLLVCIVCAALGWGVFLLLGKYTFIVMLSIVMALLLSKTRKP